MLNTGMTPVLAGIRRLLALIVALRLPYRPLGDHMARAYAWEKHLRSEKWVCKAIGANPGVEMRRPAYPRGMLAFSAVSGLRVHRVAERNRIDVTQVEKLVASPTDGRILDFVGESRVNVLKLNIALKARMTRG
ncbi:hypothetical protein GCM10010365_46850 [Streptomyces poonensis]|uniref:Uncharacterized protein n=1 Tax=Streptomyces poonensis TaxID=68255 RepID=A0A918UMF9_9ACTN|nr:hypothetical protein GCM10010365_46850 [Streptomyces poonensis]